MNEKKMSGNKWVAVLDKETLLWFIQIETSLGIALSAGSIDTSRYTNDFMAQPCSGITTFPFKNYHTWKGAVNYILKPIGLKY